MHQKYQFSAPAELVWRHLIFNSTTITRVSLLKSLKKSTLDVLTLEYGCFYVFTIFYPEFWNMLEWKWMFLNEYGENFYCFMFFGFRLVEIIWQGLANPVALLSQINILLHGFYVFFTISEWLWWSWWRSLALSSSLHKPKSWRKFLLHHPTPSYHWAYSHTNKLIPAP